MCIYVYISTYVCVQLCGYDSCFIQIWCIGLVGRVFANGPGDPGLIPGRVIPKT